VPQCASTATSGKTFDCLKTANSSAILQGLLASLAEAPEAFGFDPTIDGPGGLFPDIPSRLFAKGQFARLPFIAGTNLDEG
jgi:acetylcholinesterase